MPRLSPVAPSSWFAAALGGAVVGLVVAVVAVLVAMSLLAQPFGEPLAFYSALFVVAPFLVPGSVLAGALVGKISVQVQDAARANAAAGRGPTLGSGAQRVVPLLGFLGAAQAAILIGLLNTSSPHPATTLRFLANPFVLCACVLTGVVGLLLSRWAVRHLDARPLVTLVDLTGGQNLLAWVGAALAATGGLLAGGPLALLVPEDMYLYLVGAAVGIPASILSAWLLGWVFLHAIQNTCVSGNRAAALSRVASSGQ